MGVGMGGGGEGEEPAVYIPKSELLVRINISILASGEKRANNKWDREKNKHVRILHVWYIHTYVVYEYLVLVLYTWYSNRFICPPVYSYVLMVYESSSLISCQDMLSCCHVVRRPPTQVSPRHQNMKYVSHTPGLHTYIYIPGAYHTNQIDTRLYELLVVLIILNIFSV